MRNREVFIKKKIMVSDKRLMCRKFLSLNSHTHFKQYFLEEKLPKEGNRLHGFVKLIPFMVVPFDTDLLSS